MQHSLTVAMSNQFFLLHSQFNRQSFQPNSFFTCMCCWHVLCTVVDKATVDYTCRRPNTFLGMSRAPWSWHPTYSMFFHNYTCLFGCRLSGCPDDRRSTIGCCIYRLEKKDQTYLSRPVREIRKIRIKQKDNQVITKEHMIYMVYH
jgi:hypothetical protein